MRDEQTGTFWQQISGRAISGPMAGSQLELVYSDELTFALWRSQSSGGTVLKPVARDAQEYATKDWDVKMRNARTVLDFPKSGLQARDLVLGIAAFGAAKAYPVDRVLSEKLIEDHLGEQSIVLVVGPDEKSIRIFRARVGNEPATEYYRIPGLTQAKQTNAANQPLFMDAATGSQWSFAGCAIDGQRKGECLAPVWGVKDYWFDWRNYHPDTAIFRR